MSHPVEIRAPAEQTEGTRSQILRWLKSVGESVTANEPLIEIDTDKVTVEVPSPGSGTLLEIVRQEQDEIGPGELLGRIGAASAAAATNGSSDVVAEAGPAGISRDGMGNGSAESATAAKGLAVGATATGGLAAGGVATEAAGLAVGDAATGGPAASDVTLKASAAALSPAVRRLLAENGLAASQVRGTGQRRAHNR